jgi:hypothetical protein
MHMASAAVPDSSEPDITGNTIEQFKAADKSIFSTDHPVSKAAMLFLGQVWPQTVPFEELLNQARSMVAAGQGIDNSPEKTARDAEVLATNLLMAYTQSAQLLELHVHPPRFATDISQRPLASPVARWQIEQNAVKITNLRHERVKLDPFQRYVMQRLDGKHSLPELIEALAALVETGQFSLKHKAQPVEEPQQIREMLTSLVQRALPQLARQALLVA